MATKAQKFIGDHSVYLAALTRAFADPRAVDLLDELLTCQPMNARALIDLVKHFTVADHRRRQQDAANKKHASSREARVFVHRLWHAKRYKYPSNIEFSRVAAAQVLEKFGVDVKAETIARDWLNGIGESRSTAFRKDARAYVDGRFINSKLRHK